MCNIFLETSTAVFYVLLSVCEITFDPFKNKTTNPIMLQFVLYNAMVYCVKGFGKIKENTDSKFSLVYRGSNFIIYMTDSQRR